MSVSSKLRQPPVRGSVFRYGNWTADEQLGVLTCRYSLDGREFTERVTLAPGPRWHTDAARAAARLVFLLAGVSYYKTAAPPVIDLGPTALTAAELVFLREFYLQGLGEFAYRNTLDLTPLRIEARRADAQASGRPKPAPQQPQQRALVPFGGGIDSIVTHDHGVSLEETFKYEDLIFEEDRPVANNQMPREAPLELNAQVHTRADRFSVSYRKLYVELLETFARDRGLPTDGRREKLLAGLQRSFGTVPFPASPGPEAGPQWSDRFQHG